MGNFSMSILHQHQEQQVTPKWEHTQLPLSWECVKIEEQSVIAQVDPL
jgi:hypothetical protein